MVAQPHLPRRPADDGALRLRPRPDPALPREVRAVPHPLRRHRPDVRAARSRWSGSPATRSVPTTPRSAPSHEGECVVVYPEGTLTRDPDLWPMTGKSGAARIALATGAPVIPVGHWGAQDVLAPYAKRPHLFPRKHVVMKAGAAGAARRPAARRPRPRRWSPRPPSGSCPPSPTSSPSSAASSRRRERFDPRIHGVRDRDPDDEPVGATPQEGRRENPTKVAVFSAGSWGTAFSVVLGDAGNDVVLWARRDEVADADQHQAREHRLPARHRAARPRARHDGRRPSAAADADVVVLTVPSQTLRANLTDVGAAHARRRPCWSR